MISISKENFYDYFKIEKLATYHNVSRFTCEHEDCANFLKQDALRFQDNHIANTFVFADKQNQVITAFMSLVADAVKLEEEEKNRLNLSDISFETLPAAKIAKLAVHSEYAKHYKYIGSFAIAYACSMLRFCNRDYIACRVITIDADIEYDKNLPLFYKKNGFIALQNKRYTKRTKTKPMYVDIYSSETTITR